MMCATNPWIRIGRQFDECLTIVQEPAREVYVARSSGAVRGFVIVTMRGAVESRSLSTGSVLWSREAF